VSGYACGTPGKAPGSRVKILLVLVVVIGVQLLVFGSVATASMESGAFDETSPVAEWVTSGSAAKQGFAGGVALFGVGLALLLYKCLVGWGLVDGGGPSASTVILALLTTVLGVTLWFDALFLGLFEAKRQARPAFDVATIGPDEEAQAKPPGIAL
jgi:hypothetical protein